MNHHDAILLANSSEGHATPRVIVRRSNGRATATGAAIGSLVSAVVTLLFGAAFAAAGWYGLTMNDPFTDGVSDTAVIVGVEPGTSIIDGIAHDTYFPVYEFDDADHRVYRVSDHTGGTATHPTVGDTVEISYRPENPLDVRRTDVQHTWLWSFVAIGALAILLSLTMFAGAIGSLVRGHRRRRTARPVQQSGPVGRRR